jgi:thiol-disulfide isomerase/thioredoxin
MADLRGKVVLVDFWTYSCINCIRTLPYITSWNEKYRDKGLVIIGVHAPEFEFEKNADNVKKALEKYGIKYPVAQDNNLSTWQAFKNHYWPAHYLIDKEGKVVYTHFGEGHYDITENNIRYLLDITDGGAPMEEHDPSGMGQSPETYLGYGRGENFAGGEIMRDQVNDYTPAASLAAHAWDLGGSWTVQREKIVSSDDAALRFQFKAKKVFLVLGTRGAAVDVNVTVDGQPANSPDVKDGYLTVTDHRLYELADSENGRGLLEIKAAPGLEAYAFTFGN